MQIAGYLIIANADNLPMLLSAMAFFGLGMGMAGPGYTVSATLAVDSHEQGALAGLLGSAAGMGFVVGPIVGGFLYRLGHTLPFWCAAGVLTLVTLSIWNIGAEQKDEASIND